MTEHQLPEAIRHAFAENKSQQLGSLIHNLKGSAANIAAKSLHHQCHEIEQVLHHQEMPTETDISMLLNYWLKPMNTLNTTC